MCHDLSKTYNVRLICLNKFQTRYDLHPRPPYDNTQTIPPTVGTHPRCVRREATGDFYPTYFRFRSDINTLRSPWNFGRTWGTSLRQTRYRHPFFNFILRHHLTTTHKQSPTVGTHPRSVRRRPTGDFRPTYFLSRSDINALRSPWNFGRTLGTSLRLTLHCKFSILHSDITARQRHKPFPNRRDTPQVCPPRGNRRFPHDIFPLPFGHKKRGHIFRYILF